MFRVQQRNQTQKAFDNKPIPGPRIVRGPSVHDPITWASAFKGEIYMKNKSALRVHYQTKY